jgi:hypothetical protein
MSMPAMHIPTPTDDEDGMRSGRRRRAAAQTFPAHTKMEPRGPHARGRTDLSPDAVCAEARVQGVATPARSIGGRRGCPCVGLDTRLSVSRKVCAVGGDHAPSVIVRIQDARGTEGWRSMQDARGGT